MKIKDKSVVSFNYKLTGESGALLDESGDKPLSYMHGSGSLISGLEKELDGKTIGDSFQITVAPEEAYGEIQPQLIQTLAKNMFQGVDELETGMQFEAQGPDGASMMVVVEKVEGDEITINGNHPLAGKTLTFDISIDDVREASEEEISHGHAH